MVSCDNSPERKAEIVLEERKDLADAKEDLYKAIHDSIADYNTIKTDAETRIKAYDNKIAELRVTVQLEKNPLRAAQENALNEYALKSAKLKSSMMEYNERGNDNWTAFKTRFNNEMDELGKSIDALTKEVTK